MWTQIPRIFSITKKQFSLGGRKRSLIFRSRFLFKYFLWMIIGIKILSSVSLESLFPVKHNHFVWWLIWQWSIEWGPQCQRGGTTLPHQHFSVHFFPKSTSFYRWGAIYPGSSDHVDLQAKQKFSLAVFYHKWKLLGLLYYALKSSFSLSKLFL